METAKQVGDAIRMQYLYENNYARAHFDSMYEIKRWITYCEENGYESELGDTETPAGNYFWFLCNNWPNAIEA